MTRRCSHPHCRTSLDEYPVECPRRLPFCEHCTWEDGCDLCSMLADARRIWDDAANHRPTPPRPGDDAAEAWAEQRKEERALPHADPREDDRAADRYYENRRGA